MFVFRKLPSRWNSPTPVSRAAPARWAELPGCPRQPLQRWGTSPLLERLQNQQMVAASPGGRQGTGQLQHVRERPLCLPWTRPVCRKGPFLLADEAGVWLYPERVLRGAGSAVTAEGDQGLSPQQSPLPPGEPGARPPARSEADQTLQLFRGGRAHGVFRAGQRL